ncbi:hypothetical protein, partial [uncultured Dialister sp.]|uniref:hypothetical protein n=1 Tax=uncultured Dialister sp. TaxID=278064 RepID=UPI00265FF658
HKNSRIKANNDLISASLRRSRDQDRGGGPSTFPAELSKLFIQKIHTKRGCEKMLEHFFTAPFLFTMSGQMVQMV